jgi:lysophospholipase L1-like esterase
VRKSLNPRARFIAAESTGVELRFVTEAPTFRLVLAAHETDVDVHVYRGGFGHSDHTLAAGTTKVLTLTPPELFGPVEMASVPSGPFSPGVWRVLISGGSVGYLGLEALGFPVRPPRPDEKPGLRWLAYGSSITNSWGKGYPHQAARRLGVDVLNKGMSGSCQCEPELAEHFLAKETWDFATLELGVNMRGGFTVEEFAARATHLVRRLREERPDAPIALITHFTNRDHAGVFPSRDGEETLEGKRQQGFDEVLRELAADPELNLHLFEGRDLLPDAEGLSCDLLHPSDYGHIQMGERLAERLKPLLP